LLFIPGSEGTSVTTAANQQDFQLLLQGGLSLADIVVPKTRPEKVHQLTLFGDA
jgi:hypothetical protein